MFNIGGGELIVILLIALIVLGPQRLPDAARQIGKTMGDLRRLSSGFQNEMRSALETADDPTRVAARRNPLAAEVVPATEDAPSAEDEAPGVTPTGEPPVDAAADSIAAVSAQPSAPSKDTPPDTEARAAAKEQGSGDVPEPPLPRTEP